MTEQNADFFYRRAMESEQSPELAEAARADFLQAAKMGHNEALSAFSHYMFSGQGGPQDQSRALLYMWSPFDKASSYSLEELADMLNSYAELNPKSLHAHAAINAAQNLEKIKPLFESVSSFMHGLSREWCERHMA